MLKAAFNALTRLHSRPALLKRPGATVDMYSPMRVTPSNYFRFLRGPEYTTIRGIEYIIPVDSITGQFSQTLKFPEPPTTGTFKLQYALIKTGALNYDTTAATIQSALVAIPGLSNVAVTGDFTAGFLIVFRGMMTAPDLGLIVESTLDQAGTLAKANTSWPEEKVKKADRILVDGKVYAIDEIMAMPDVGGVAMGYRVRAD